jgi:Fe-Mn family superoxide dismutase
MDLHELYLGSRSDDATVRAPAMGLALDANFGSAERWREAFVALAGAARGAGRVLLSFQPGDGTLANQRVAADAAAPAGSEPILALDLAEHALHLGLGTDADPAEAADAFIGHIDWPRVYERYRHAVHDASEPFAASHAEAAGALIVDVRRAAMFEQAGSMIPGARWRDPTAVERWAAELPAQRQVVVYCVYGHEVGRATALRLRAAGLKARFLEGGMDGWAAAGRPLEAKPAR